LELEASAAASLNQNAKTRARGVYPVQPTPNPPAAFCSLLAIPLVRKPLTWENASEPPARAAPETEVAGRVPYADLDLRPK
jgi:hypothetical protein